MAEVEICNFGMRANAKMSPKILESDYVYDHFIPNETYYLFVVEGKIPKATETRLVKDIEASGIKSYVITSAIKGEFKESDMKGSKTNWMDMNKSNWGRFITYKGVHCEAIMAFGRVLLQINKGDDVETDFFTSPFTKNYYYLGHGFIGTYDTFIFPVHSLNLVYHPHTVKGIVDPTKIDINWTTRFFRKQLNEMQTRKEYPDMSDYTITIIKSKEEFIDLMNKHMNEEYCSFDLETNSLNFFTGKIKCLTLCWDVNNGYYIDWENVDIDSFAAMARSARHFLGVNPKFDIKFLWHNGFPEDIYPTDDVMLMSHALDSDRYKGLKSQAFYYTYFGGYEDALVKFKKETGIQDYSKIPVTILPQYATLDVIVALRSYFALKDNIEYVDRVYPNEKMADCKDEWTIWRWYTDMMMRAYPCLIDAEYRGIYFDQKTVDNNRAFLKNRIIELKNELGEIFNVSPNFEWFSVEKLGKLLEDAGYSELERSSKGWYATHDSNMQEWKRRNEKGINQILELRLANSCLNTFIGTGVSEDSDNERDIGFGEESLSELKSKLKAEDKEGETGWDQFFVFHPEDNTLRIHHNYNAFGTKSYRCIANNPNMQNIPTRGKYAPYVKRCFSVPNALFIYVEDYGQKYKFRHDELVNTERGLVKAEDLLETDHLMFDER